MKSSSVERPSSVLIGFSPPVTVLVEGENTFIVTVCGLWLLQTLSLCVSICLSVCVCVCPAFAAYVSRTMDRVLIKLNENVET